MVLAVKMIRDGGEDTNKRIAVGFRRAVARSPEADETAALASLARLQAERFAADKEAAKKLLSVGEWPAPEGIEAAELAAWTSVARAILNLHETITRD